MMKKILVFMAFLLIAGAAFALTPVTDVNVSKITLGGGFIGPADVNINFTVIDTNADVFVDNTYIVDISYSAVKGAETTSIANDYNLGNFTKNNGYCDTNIGAVRTTCHYPWLATSIVSITDGNYYIDVNIIVYYGAVA